MSGNLGLLTSASNRLCNFWRLLNFLELHISHKLITNKQQKERNYQDDLRIFCRAIFASIKLLNFSQIFLGFAWTSVKWSEVKWLSHSRLFATPWTVACTKLLHPRDFLGKSIGVGCCFLLQGIFPTQGLNPGLLNCRQTLYHLNHQGSSLY